MAAAEQAAERSAAAAEQPTRVAALEAEVAALRIELEALRGDRRVEDVSAATINSSAATSSAAAAELPWVVALRQDPAQRRVRLREWEDVAWRRANGWLGRDLCHDPDGKGVRVLEYYWDARSAVLTGVVWFGPNCESHRGLCHGGAYTSLLDDVCGHYAFLRAEPWHGATVQVNVSLKKPIRIGQVLRVVGRAKPADAELQTNADDYNKKSRSNTNDAEADAVGGDKKRKRSRRKKIEVLATLDDGGGNIYATLEGLSVGGLRITADDSHKNDAIAQRRWANAQVDGAPVYMDTGWSF